MKNENYNRMVTLKEIAEILNTSDDMPQMLQNVLNKLLAVLELTSGWIFLSDEVNEYECIAHHNLPPALTWDNNSPMCSSACWCLNRYWEGRLHHAVNIISCKRIEDAIKLERGETKEIQHHASVALEAGGERFGVLNVAAPNKQQFTEEELALLQSIAFQIGMGIKRIKTHLLQQRRAEDYAKLAQVSRELSTVLTTEEIPQTAVRIIGSIFSLSTVLFVVREKHVYSLRAVYTTGQAQKTWLDIPELYRDTFDQVLHNNSPLFIDKCPDILQSLSSINISSNQYAMFIPMQLSVNANGILIIGSLQKKVLTEFATELLLVLSDHISLAMENARLYAYRKELVKIEERNRLARDLHDSVLQILFSISLTARGMEFFITEHATQLHQSSQEIQKLAQDAHQEMRFLIWQLRPAGLEEGLVTALIRYANEQGLMVREQSLAILPTLSRVIDEALWRIGQEAINNVRKHAGVNDISITCSIDKENALLEISDLGCGFSLDQTKRNYKSLGIYTMCERAEMLGGECFIDSSPGRGTKVRVKIPLVENFETRKADED